MPLEIKEILWDTFTDTRSVLVTYNGRLLTITAAELEKAIDRNMLSVGPAPDHEPFDFPELDEEDDGDTEQ